MLNSVTVLTQSELISAIVRRPLVVTPNTSVMEAIASMSGIRVVCAATEDTDRLDELHTQARSSCVAIVEDGRLLGILTERDIVRLSSEQRDLANLPIRDVMTSNVVTLRAADFTDIFIAVNLLRQHHIRHLPIVDDLNCLVGLVTHESLQQTSRPVDLLRLRIVAEVMTAEVVCAAPELSMLEIARLMTVHRVSSVIIVQPALDEHQNIIQMPIGIVTERDIVQFQALSLNLATYQVQAVMSTPIFAVKSSDSLWLVQQILAQRFIQRLAVTGDRGELLGIVTQTSLLQALNPLELYKLAEALEAKVLRLEADKVKLLEHHTIDLEHQIEERTKKLTATVAQEQLVSKLSSQIRSSLNLTEILDTAVRELRSILCCSRISIWKFQADGRTLDIVADCQNLVSSNIVGVASPTENRQVYDPCFDPNAYPKGKVRVIADIYTASISACDRDLLADLHIRAKILAPILTVLDGAVPWGLIDAIETNRPRDWQGGEIALIQQIATQMAIAIRQATAYEQVQSLNVELELRVAQRTAELQESQQFLQTVIETVPLAIFWKDRASRYLGCNYNFAQDANLSLSEEIVGMTDDDLPWGGVAGVAYQAEDRQVIDSGLPRLRSIEVRTRADGQSIWVETNKIPLRNINGETIGILGTYQDITEQQAVLHERKQTEQLIRQQAERELVLREITQKIRRSLDLKTIFETSVHEIRQFMETDRVGILKLNTDPNELHFGGGKFVAESVGTGFKALLGIQMHEPSFGKRISPLYQQGKIQAIENIYRAGLSDDEIEFLAQFQVQAHLVLPLLNGSMLWGLLWIDDCTAPRSWQDEINFVQQIAEQIGIGIQQATLYEKVQLELDIRWQAEESIALQLRQQQTLGSIDQQIRNSLNLEEILATATLEIKELMMVDRVTIFRLFPDGKSRVIEEVVSPEYPDLLDMDWEDEQFSKEGFEFYIQGKTRIVVDVMQDAWSSCLQEYMGLAQVKSKIVAPILLPFRDDNTHRWVNANKDVQLWGLLIVHSCGFHRQWQDTEAQLLQQIADRLAIAIKQANLFEQLQQELTDRQQAEQSIALQLRQQQTLGSIAQQIRNSLKLEEILATATANVKELMIVDRVTIFRVSADLHLRAVEEVVSTKYPSLMAKNWEDAQLSQPEFEFYLDGRPNVVVDLQQDPWSICLQDYINEIQVKSKIVAPILLPSGGSDPDIDTWDEPHLWGLLSIHSCSSQRHWQNTEAQLLQQIADQLALAIHQANLFEKLQQELIERGQTEVRLIESNKELARATRLKDEFLASMSHELRTPLNAILGMSESLQDGVFGEINNRQRKSILTIEKSGKHLLALINDILDLSKMEANKFNLEFVDVSIPSLCQNSILFIKELAHKRQIRVKTQMPEQLKQLNIQVDDLRFRQVLINLLSNAVKFTPEGGSITLDVRISLDGESEGFNSFLVQPATSTFPIPPNSVAPPPCKIAFSIIDTGIGIAAENMDKLFQSFVQIDSSLSRQYAGTGLGLSLVKRIVEMHGGHISVQSEVNRGSCFTVSLPFDPTMAIAVPPSSTLVYPLVGTDAPAPDEILLKRQTSILLVEDDKGNIETMITYLQSRGYRMVVAENGYQAISILEDCANNLDRSDNPDVILMDIQMPGMDGFEATRCIRQIAEYAHVPIIALTALAMSSDRQKCLDAGATEYMSKPVKLSQLVANIEALLKGGSAGGVGERR